MRSTSGSSMLSALRRNWDLSCANFSVIGPSSTREEAYSLAMLLQEYRAQQKRRFNIQIFATDIDEEAIGRARHGLYPEGIANHVSPERLKSFFVREDNHYRVKNELRDCMTFA